MIATNAAHTPAVSVVIPTYRRPHMLLRCLEAVTKQDLSADCYEVLVCDDGPDPQTRAAVEALAASQAARGLRIAYVAVTATQGPAGARNAGWRAASAGIIAFTDDDTIPEINWLSKGLACITEGVWAVSGAVEVPFDAPKYSDAPSDYEIDASGLSRAEFVTANCFVRRSALATLNGFDERYTSAWREDSDLQFRILRAGGCIVRSPHARVVHPVRPARWGVSIAQQRKSQFDALLYKTHRELYQQRIRTAPPWNYYVIVTSLIVAVIAALTAALTPKLMLGIAPGVAANASLETTMRIIGALALIVWATLTLRFVQRRLANTSHSPVHIAEMVWTSMIIPCLSVFWRIYGAVKFKVAFL